LKGKGSSPPSFKFTQISFASEIKDWMNDIIQRLGLKFEYADIEVKDPEKKRADVILWEKRKKKPALLIEIWDAKTDPWGQALDSALSKAWKNNIPYFAVWNLTHFYCWDTFAQGEIIDRLWWPHSGVVEVVCEAHTYDDAILRYSDSIKKYLENFLSEFEQIYYGFKAKPLLGIDERFIYWLRGAINALSIPILENIKMIANEDADFRKNLVKYFKEQGWSFRGVDEDFEKVARQYVYLLMNKILFYNVLRSIPRYRRHLPKITIPVVGLTGSTLKERLDNYFKKAYEITGNYETILLTDFLDSITPSDEAANLLVDFINRFGEYDFSEIVKGNYEILGNIFQKLIPEGERHKLGQYYTRSDVVDLIVGFCVRSSEDKVLDGACGAGTFLVRSYVRKKLMDPRKTHRELIKDLYGVDIAKFPAHLTIINLASKDLSEIENYPNVLHKDFFDVNPGGQYTLAEVRIETLSGEKKIIGIPTFFDAVVMNPPYTRQEEMEDVLEEEKDKAYRRCIEDWKCMSRYPAEKEPKLSKRASIYVYFFIHGGSFLKEGGRLGLITSNSWLDVDYGGDLQRFFLENFKIKAVIESKVEKWFEDADINTAITILERCSNREERNRNVVKFVQLKKPLKEFIPPVADEEERWGYVERFIQLIESKDGYYEDEKIRVFTKTQRELWEEGYDDEEEEYSGSKWGKYIRAPDIFYKILEKGKGIFVPLKEVAEVKRGFTTGANEFFYLTEEKIKKWGIEREFWMHPLKKDEEVPVPEHIWKDKGGEYFKASQYAERMKLEDVLRDDGYVYWVPNYVIKSPRECKSILVDPRSLKYRVLLIHKDKSELKGTNVLKYIKWGESQEFHKRPTCLSRDIWYELPEVRAKLIWIKGIWDRHFIPITKFELFIDQQLYAVQPKSNAYHDVLAALLNSTYFAIFQELTGRVTFGEGILWLAVYEPVKLLVPDLRIIKTEILTKLCERFNKLVRREIGSVFEEIGADSPEKVSLDKVKPDRRELDEIVMGEILGLTEEEQLEVYRAVIDMVKSRIEKAKSTRKRKKVEELNVDDLVASVLKEVERIYGIEAKKFPDDYIGKGPSKIIEVPKGSIVEAGFDLEGPYVQIDGEKIRCTSIYEAKYIKFAILAGKTRIPIPEDEKMLKKAVKEREKLLKYARSKVEDFLDEAIVDKKLRERVRSKVFKKLGI
jgi:type I restriction-modification system DNA methylase subunit